MVDRFMNVIKGKSECPNCQHPSITFRGRYKLLGIRTKHKCSVCGRRIKFKWTTVLLYELQFLFVLVALLFLDATISAKVLIFIVVDVILTIIEIPYFRIVGEEDE